MDMLRFNRRGFGVLSALSLVVTVAACSRVKPEELDASLASLRADMQREMQAGDDAVSDVAAAVGDHDNVPHFFSPARWADRRP